jgi:Tfp pilus assembly protein PilO
MWVCVIAGLFVCDFIACGYLPSKQRLTSLQQAQTQQERMIQMAMGQGAELPGLRDKLRDTHRAIERFETRVPSDNALGAFLQQMASVMTERELTDQVVLPGKELEMGGLGCIPIHMTCKGTLTNLFRFFDRLQTLDRLVRIEKVTLENDADFTGRLTLQTEAFIFYQLKPSGIQDAATKEPSGGARNGA